MEQGDGSYVLGLSTLATGRHRRGTLNGFIIAKFGVLGDPDFSKGVRQDKAKSRGYSLHLSSVSEATRCAWTIFLRRTAAISFPSFMDSS